MGHWYRSFLPFPCSHSLGHLYNSCFVLPVGLRAALTAAFCHRRLLQCSHILFLLHLTLSLNTIGLRCWMASDHSMQQTLRHLLSVFKSLFEWRKAIDGWNIFISHSLCDQTAYGTECSLFASPMSPCDFECSFFLARRPVTYQHVASRQRWISFFYI